jgi:hypothetical protein
VRSGGLALGALALAGLSAIFIVGGAGPASAATDAGRTKSATATDTGAKPSAADANDVADDYQPKGIPLGQFLLLPSLNVSENWESNVYASTYNAKSDFYSEVSPEFALQSRFARNALTVYGQLNRTDYSTYTSDSRTGGHVTADGRLDVSSRTKVTGHVYLYADHEARGAPTSVSSAAKPTPVKGYKSEVELSHIFNRLTVSGTVEADRYIYQNVPDLTGGTIVEDDRNRNEYIATERAAYEVRPGYSAVLQTTQNQRLYQNLDTTGLNRTSDGYSVQGGLGLDITKLIKGDVLAGYMSQSYDSSTLRPVNGYATSVLLNWTPTETTIVVPSLQRTVEETTQTGASAMVQTAGSLLVRHELRRNFLLSGYAGETYYQYSGIGATAWLTSANVALTYAFNRNLFVGGQLGEQNRRSSIDGDSYRDTTITARIGLRM